MAKIKPMGLIESMSGKLCQDSDVSFVRRNGKVFTAKLCHPRTSAPSVRQQKVMLDFKEVHERVKGIMADRTSAEYKAYEKAWKQQTKYATLRGYIFAQEYGK